MILKLRETGQAERRRSQRRGTGGWVGPSPPHNHEVMVGFDIVMKALEAPARQIAINAGEDGSVVVGKILDKDQYNYGFDAQNSEYGKLMTNGIIDHTK